MPNGQMKGFYPTDPGQAMKPEPFAQFETHRTKRNDAVSSSPNQVANQPNDNSQQILRAGRTQAAEQIDPAGSKQLVGQGVCSLKKRSRSGNRYEHEL